MPDGLATLERQIFVPAPCRAHGGGRLFWRAIDDSISSTASPDKSFLVARACCATAQPSRLSLSLLSCICMCVGQAKGWLVIINSEKVLSLSWVVRLVPPVTSAPPRLLLICSWLLHIPFPSKSIVRLLHQGPTHTRPRFDFDSLGRRIAGQNSG
jgi:hypothetical protein